jgi:hypothetical protein
MDVAYDQDPSEKDISGFEMDHTKDGRIMGQSPQEKVWKGRVLVDEL